MIDWTKGMSQTYTYWLVDPLTWLDAQQLTEVVSCRIIRDIDSDLLESASLTIDNREFSEEYVRVYLEVTQGDEAERVPMGTFLCQTPKRRVAENVMSLEVKAYSSLVEYKEREPTFGTAVSGDAEQAFAGIAAMFRPPYTGSVSGNVATTISGDKDNWLYVSRRAMASVGTDVMVDPYGRPSLRPKISQTALRPVWTFTDDNSSIMLPSYDETFDWYNLPNVCRLTWSEPLRFVSAVAVNDDPASDISTVSRGREVTLTVKNPEELHVGCTQTEADAVAAARLEEASSVERTYVISHGYCPVTIGDAVAIRYNRYDIDVVARVTNQEIDCKTGTIVKTTAKSVTQMWRR